jgi:hypothetical protein
MDNPGCRQCGSTECPVSVLDGDDSYWLCGLHAIGHLARAGKEWTVTLMVLAPIATAELSA